MRAHVFDMDGTLLRRTSAPALLAAALGRAGSLADLEDRLSAGTATSAQFARAIHEMWGIVPIEVVRQAFLSEPLLANIREVLADIRDHDERSCLITMSPDYFAEQFLEFGFDAVFASRFPRSAAAELDESAILNPEDKPRHAAAFCAEHGLALGDAVAYGDSMSDVFLFAEVGLSVSVNGDHHVAELADIVVEGDDLMLAYRAARESLGVSPPSGSRRSAGGASPRALD
jgi:phosphoserine phosphatase